MNYDVVFINPGNAYGVYQELAKDYSAIEPPTWALLLANALRKKNYESIILDFDGEPKDIDQSVKEIAETQPKIVIFVLYGQTPNHGTTMMIGASELADHLKKNFSNLGISIK